MGYKTLFGSLEEKRSSGRPPRRLEDKYKKMDPERKVGCELV
jgi:hypothetical protein